jgi:diguanylate cyclase (GGDEF)-like protein/PAS domain S-box-containing protein
LNTQECVFYIDLMFPNQDRNNEDLILDELFKTLDTQSNLNEIFQAIADGVTVQDHSGKVLYANDAAARIMGLSDYREVINGDSKSLIADFEILDNDGLPFQLDLLPGRRVLAGEDCKEVIVYWRNKKTGIGRWSEIKARPIRNSSGEIKFAVNVFRDITDQRQVLEDYERQSRRNKHILESITDGFLALDRNWEFTYINKQAEPYFPGKTSQELLGKNLVEVSPSITSTVAYGKIRRSLEQNISLRFEEYFPNINKWVEISTYPSKDGIAIYFRDISESKNYEETLKQSNILVQSISDAVVSTDSQYNIQSWNRGAEELYGWQEFEVLGQAAPKVLHTAFPDGYDTAKVIDDLSARDNWKGEVIQTCKNGRQIHIMSSVSTIRDREGNITGYVSVNRDITYRKLVDETNAKLAAIVSSSQDAIIGKTLDGIITSWNLGAESTYGYKAEEVLGKHISVLSPDHNADDTQFILDKVRAGASLEHYETTRRTKDGRNIIVSVTVSPIKNSQGIVTGVSAVARDITESKLTVQTQEFMSQASALLASSLDYQTTLGRVAKLAVPKFGDWCSIELLSDDGEIQTVAVEHIDPEKIKLANEFRTKYPTDKNAPGGVHTVIKTGISQMVPIVTEEMIRPTAKDQEHFEMIMKLQINSIMIVPLTARSKTLGAITFVWAEAKKIYNEKDLAFAEELGRRAGVAVDNAILFKTVLNEIEQRTKISGELQLSEERYRSLAAATTSIIWVSDPEGRFISKQNSWEEYTGQAQEEYKDYGWVNAIAEEDREAILAEWKLAITAKRRSFESAGRLWNAKLKQYRHFVARSIPLLSDDGNIREWIGSINDVDDRKKAEDQLKYQFHHDFLTDLPNRIFLNQKFEHAIEEATINQKSVALMMLDLDRFKQINESLGHAVGDRLIQEVALRLRTCIRDDFALARLGGDEFGILHTGVDSEEEVAKLCNKILEDFRPAFYLDNHELYISPSIGISMYPYDGREPATLFKNAEAALYRAKDHGRNNYQFYTTTMNSAAYERLTMESRLRHAIENNELVLFYQPQIEVKSGKIVGAEELIRWQRPDGSLILPDRFIPLAEANGLIEPIGEFALRESLRQAKIWYDAGFELSIAINLSARQFKQKNFEQMVIRIIEESKVDPRYIELELTETVLAENPETVYPVMNALRERGVKFVLDDFSTGYSSLRYIKQFPVDMLKIERSFLKNVPVDVQNSAIVKSIITLGQSLGMEVTAEGVESKNQLAFLRDQLCHRAQGYLFNGAMPAHSLSEILNEDRYVSVVASLDKSKLP